MRLEKAQNDPWGWVHAIKLCKEKESTDSLFGRVVSKQYWHIQVYFRNRFLTTICQWLGNHILQQGSYGDLLSVHEWTFFSSSILMILLDWTCQLVFTMWIHTLWFNCGKKTILCKPVTILKNQWVETPNSWWTVSPGKQQQQHTVKNCSMTHFCETNILSFLLLQKDKINICFYILELTGIYSWN